MESLIIDESIKTPGIAFNASSGVLEIKGKSIPENSLEFYMPVYDWLDKYISNPANQTELRVNLEYFNTSSSKCLLDIFKKLEQLSASKNGTVKVCWYYEEEDEDMMEAGDDYQALVKLPFELIGR